MIKMKQSSVICDSLGCYTVVYFRYFARILATFGIRLEAPSPKLKASYERDSQGTLVQFPPKSPIRGLERKTCVLVNLRTRQKPMGETPRSDQNHWRWVKSQKDGVMIESRASWQTEPFVSDRDSSGAQA